MLSVLNYKNPRADAAGAYASLYVQEQTTDHEPDRVYDTMAVLSQKQISERDRTTSVCH